MARATARSPKRQWRSGLSVIFYGRRARARPEEGAIVTESTRRTLPWRILVALIVVCLLAVGSWVFAEDGIADVTAKEAGAGPGRLQRDSDVAGG